MANGISDLLKEMTPEEQAEVQIFAAFVLARRKVKKVELLSNDISTKEMLKLIEESGSFDWLSSDEEDVYSITDGEEAEWPKG